MIKLEVINNEPPDYNESIIDQIKILKRRFTIVVIIILLLSILSLILSLVSMSKHSEINDKDNGIVTQRISNLERKLDHYVNYNVVNITDVCLDYNEWTSVCRYNMSDGTFKFDRFCSCKTSCSPTIHQEDTTSGAKILLSIKCFETIFSQFVLSFKISGVLISVYSVFKAPEGSTGRSLEYNFNGNYSGRFMIAMDNNNNVNGYVYQKELYFNSAR